MYTFEIMIYDEGECEIRNEVDNAGKKFGSMMNDQRVLTANSAKSVAVITCTTCMGGAMIPTPPCCVLKHSPPEPELTVDRTIENQMITKVCHHVVAIPVIHRASLKAILHLEMKVSDPDTYRVHFCISNPVNSSEN